LLFLSFVIELINNLFFVFIYCPKFFLTAAMFGAAALAVAPQIIHAEAPVPCPAAVNTLLSKCSKFEAQFRNPDLAWDASDAISNQDRENNLAVIRTRVGATAKMVNLDASQFHLLANTTWMIPDGRRCPAHVSSDPIAAGIAHLSSLALFELLPLPKDPDLPFDENNLFWQATCVANKILASDGHPLVDIPINIVLTFTQVCKGYP
jgi:hypothetical protein